MASSHSQDHKSRAANSVTVILMIVIRYLRCPISLQLGF